ncbi:MAG: hypothetical protein R3E12_03170 [Candidatus Eisenbacteria bacterium]
MKLALRLSLCVVLLVPVGVQADVTLRTVGPQRTWTDADAALIDASWLHVKFVEGSDVNLVNDVVGFEDRTLDLTAVNRALASHGAVELRRTFRGDRATLRELKHAGELRSGTVGPDLSLWYDVRVTGGVEQVVQLVNALNACPGVEIAHPSPCVESAVLRQESSVSDAAGAVGGSASRGGTPDFTALQEYLMTLRVGSTRRPPGR